MSNMHRPQGVGSAEGSRQSSMAHSGGPQGRAASTMSQGLAAAGGAILEDGATSIYQDIDIPAPTSGVDGGRPLVCSSTAPIYSGSCLSWGEVPLMALSV